MIWTKPGNHANLEDSLIALCADDANTCPFRGMGWMDPILAILHGLQKCIAC